MSQPYRPYVEVLIALDENPQTCDSIRDKVYAATGRKPTHATVRTALARAGKRGCMVSVGVGLYRVPCDALAADGPPMHTVEDLTHA